MEQKLLESQIALLQSSIFNMRILLDEGVDLTDAIEEADSKLHELERQAGWYSVSPIRNGSATESVYCGPHDDCINFASFWLGEHPEDKGNIIITPL